VKSSSPIHTIAAALLMTCLSISAIGRTAATDETGRHTAFDLRAAQRGLFSQYGEDGSIEKICPVRGKFVISILTGGMERLLEIPILILFSQAYGPHLDYTGDRDRFHLPICASRNSASAFRRRECTFESRPGHRFSSIGRASA
jgi:hypothetical protein